MVFNKAFNTEYGSIDAGTARSKCRKTLLLVQSSNVLHTCILCASFSGNPIKITFSPQDLLQAYRFYLFAGQRPIQWILSKLFGTLSQTRSKKKKKEREKKKEGKSPESMADFKLILKCVIYSHYLVQMVDLLFCQFT